MKRMDYLSWDEYFMSVALLSAQRSKDNHTQVGACIVNPEIELYRLDTMECQLVVVTMRCRGNGKAHSWKPSIHLSAMQN